MNVLVKNNIEDGVFTTVVTINEFGDSAYTSEEEIELLNNYSSKVAYKNLDFTKKFKMSEGLPVVAGDEDADAVELSIRLNNQEIDVDANFEAKYSTSIKKTLDSELNDVLADKESVCAAKCILFATVIKEELKKIMDELRSKAVGFEGETEEVI